MNLKTIRNACATGVMALMLVVPMVSQAAPDASMSLVSPKSGKIEVGQTQSVKWTSAGKASKVKLNLIRKVSSNPNRYELVRTVSEATTNDGLATWVPAAKDVGNNLSLEVGCAPSKDACRASLPSASIAVINSSKFANTASAYLSIEASKNK